MIYVFGKFIPFPLRYVQFLFDFWPFEAISHIQYVGYTTLVLGPSFYIQRMSTSTSIIITGAFVAQYRVCKSHDNHTSKDTSHSVAHTSLM